MNCIIFFYLYHNFKSIINFFIKNADWFISSIIVNNSFYKLTWILKKLCGFKMNHKKVFFFWFYNNNSISWHQQFLTWNWVAREICWQIVRGYFPPVISKHFLTFTFSYDFIPHFMSPHLRFYIILKFMFI